MNFTKTALIIASATLLPFAASATSLMHVAPGEVGFTQHPQHEMSTKTRDQVRAEVLTAQRDGTLARISRNLPLASEAVRSSKTRDQVKQELLAETVSERQARQALYTGG